MAFFSGAKHLNRYLANYLTSHSQWTFHFFFQQWSALFNPCSHLLVLFLYERRFSDLWLDAFWFVLCICHPFRGTCWRQMLILHKNLNIICLWGLMLWLLMSQWLMASRTLENVDPELSQLMRMCQITDSVSCIISFICIRITQYWYFVCAFFIRIEMLGYCCQCYISFTSLCLS